MGLDVAWEYQYGLVDSYERFGVTCHLQLQISSFVLPRKKMKSAGFFF
jgi:hypothetical protein